MAALSQKYGPLSAPQATVLRLLYELGGQPHDARTLYALALRSIGEPIIALHLQRLSQLGLAKLVENHPSPNQRLYTITRKGERVHWKITDIDRQFEVLKRILEQGR